MDFRCVAKWCISITDNFKHLPKCITFFLRKYCCAFQFQWFLEMSSSLDHNLTPPPSIRVEVYVEVQQTMREKNGHRLIIIQYMHTTSMSLYIFSKRVNYILLFPSWKKVNLAVPKSRMLEKPFGQCHFRFFRGHIFRTNLLRTYFSIP